MVTFEMLPKSRQQQSTINQRLAIHPVGRVMQRRFSCKVQSGSRLNPIQVINFQNFQGETVQKLTSQASPPETLGVHSLYNCIMLITIGTTAWENL